MNSPTLHAIIFADRVIEEKNNKKGIIGTFDTIFAPNFPVTALPWGVYVALSGIENIVQFSLTLQGNDAKNPLIRLDGELKSNSKDSMIELPLNFENVTFPEPGEYTFSLQVDGKVVGARVIKLMIANMPGLLQGK
ncbi:DUF6941 family protein [Leptospira levettii]|uniref:DUF6941 family protein n=1 Tax=Leptospira levettii TaxID=2023178 RepID=UPI00223E318A|nr:hypothetical protein [Leptospira levettii]MCW7475541.1 hypothetical protein [Leptospira levettii]